MPSPQKAAPHRPEQRGASLREGAVATSTNDRVRATANGTNAVTEPELPTGRACRQLRPAATPAWPKPRVRLRPLRPDRREAVGKCGKSANPGPALSFSGACDEAPESPASGGIRDPVT